MNNRFPQPDITAEEHISLDFLQLVRYGLRRANDPLIQDTLKLADTLLKVTTPYGPAWYRYNEDGYGEHSDGTPFDGTGHGRLWPLLAGERGHYDLVAQHDPLPMLRVMAASASAAGMLPEQIWDATALPEYGLLPFQPTGSAMPLVWAHAEYIKLTAARARGRPYDRPQSVWARYQGLRPELNTGFWSLAAPIETTSPNCPLTLLLPRQATVRWSLDEWVTETQMSTASSMLTLYPLVLHPGLKPGDILKFFLKWSGDQEESPEYRITCLHP